MSNDEMKRLAEVVRAIVKKENKPLEEHFSHLTEIVNGEMLPTLELHTKYFKQILKRFEVDEQKLEKNEHNVMRLDKRQKETEAQLGIQPPPALQIT